MEKLNKTTYRDWWILGPESQDGRNVEMFDVAFCRDFKHASSTHVCHAPTLIKLRRECSATSLTRLSRVLHEHCRLGVCQKPQQCRVKCDMWGPPTGVAADSGLPGKCTSVHGVPSPQHSWCISFTWVFLTQICAVLGLYAPYGGNSLQTYLGSLDPWRWDR